MLSASVSGSLHLHVQLQHWQIEHYTTTTKYSTPIYCAQLVAGESPLQGMAPQGLDETNKM
jgi:hypothetical protein